MERSFMRYFHAWVLVGVLSGVVLWLVGCGISQPRPPASTPTPTPQITPHPIPIYPGAMVLAATTNDAMYQVMFQVAASDRDVLTYYQTELASYERQIKVILYEEFSQVEGWINLPEYRDVVITVNVIAVAAQDTVVVVWVGSNGTDPLAWYIGQPDQLFPQIAQPFAVFRPLSLPAESTVLVQRSSPPQPPVYPGAKQLKYVERHPLRVLTYDVPAPATRVRAYYDEQLRTDGWMYRLGSGAAFESYSMLQVESSKPAFGLSIEVVPISAERSIVQVVIAVSGPGGWESIPAPTSIP